jgi:ribonuclease P protein component
MNHSSLSFPKGERLSRKQHIDMLFQQGSSMVAYPLRIIYLSVNQELDAPVSLLISIPKKKIRLAVDRNHIKRRIRESYRLRKHDLTQCYTENDKKLLLAFVYLHNERSPFVKIDKAVAKAIRNIRAMNE